MRVISGYLKSRNLIGYNLSTTRPTMDKVKESLFAMIQDYVKDSVCLDLFSGSGSLGIEAISNYANSCYFVDNNKEAINNLKKNIDNLNISDKSIIIINDYKEALKSLINIKFDIIFLDPPYDYNIYKEVINYIYKNNMINDNGIIVCEHNNCLEIDNLKLIKHKNYKHKNISIYKKIL